MIFNCLYHYLTAVLIGAFWGQNPLSQTHVAPHTLILTCSYQHTRRAKVVPDEEFSNSHKVQRAGQKQQSCPNIKLQRKERKAFPRQIQQIFSQHFIFQVYGDETESLCNSSGFWALIVPETRAPFSSTLQDQVLAKLFQINS